MTVQFNELRESTGFRAVCRCQARLGRCTRSASARFAQAASIQPDGALTGPARPEVWLSEG